MSNIHASIGNVTIVPDLFIIRDGSRILFTLTDAETAFRLLADMRANDPTGSITYTLSVELPGQSSTQQPKE